MTRPTPRLSIPEVRQLLLAAQGLEGARPRKPAKGDVLAAIQRMGQLQIDTISVVARSPYLVLWSRLGAYEPRWLDEHLAAGAIFEQWAHAACFLPKELFPAHRRQVIDGDRQGKKHILRWLETNADAVEQMRAHIRDTGEVRSSDFERTDGKRGTWWDWKPEKLALEMLFATGELMVARRENFQRIYDLRERVYPDWDDAGAPPLADALRAFVLHSVRALGVARETWVADYFRLPQATGRSVARSLAADGLLRPVAIDGLPGVAYTTDAALDSLPGSSPKRTTLLSPFDPVVWDRRRASELFGFDYQIECYTPAPKRVYGYFTLPILHRGRLVGRLDPKAHRGEGRFEVRVIHLEPGVKVTERLIHDVAGAIVECAAWHATPEVTMTAANPRALLEPLRAAIGQGT
jgi:hypothetical protein